MPGARFVSPYFVWPDSTGEPIPGALLNFYVSGSAYSVRASTYADSALSTPNSNPVVADDTGTFPNIFLDPAIAYGVVLTYASDGINPPVQIWSADPITAEGITNSANASLIASVVALQAQSIGSTVTEVVTLGYYVQGDSAPAWRLRTNQIGPGPGLVQSLDGAWWVYVPETQGGDVRAFGARGTGSDDTTAINNADQFCSNVSVPLLFAAGTYGINNAGVTRHGCDWVGSGAPETILKALAQTWSTAVGGMVTGRSIHGHSTSGLTFDIGSAVLPPGSGNPGNIYYCQQFFTSNYWTVRNCRFVGIQAHVIGMAIDGGSNWSVVDNFFFMPTPSTSYNQACNISVASGVVSNYQFSRNTCIGTAFFSNGALGRIEENYLTGWSFGGGLTFGPLAACILNTIVGNVCQNSNPVVDINATYPSGIECWAAYSVVADNVCSGNSGNGILCGGPNMAVTGNVCLNNGQGVPNTSGSGILVIHAAPSTVEHTVVSNNNCVDNQVSKTQAYGYAEVFVTGSTTTMANLHVFGNQLNGNGLAPTLLASDTNAPGRSFVGPVLWVKKAVTPGTINSGSIFAAANPQFMYGAALGDVVSCSFDQDLKGCSIFGYVSATNQVNIYISNNTGSGQTLANGNVRAKASKPPDYANY